MLSSPSSTLIHTHEASPSNNFGSLAFYWVLTTLSWSSAIVKDLWLVIGCCSICRNQRGRTTYFWKGLRRIAKTGSLCCVAARPHGSNGTSGDWSMGNEPYWRTNTSYSPPPSRWDFRFTAEDLPFDSLDEDLVYESSASDGIGLFLSSPSDRSQGPQWTPPAIQEISIDSYSTATRRGRSLGRHPSIPAVEGNSANQHGDASSASRSDSSDSDSTFTSCLAPHRNFSGRRSFLTKPVHPLVFEAPAEGSESLAGSGSPTIRRDGHCSNSSSSSSTEFMDVSETCESQNSAQSFSLSEGFRCGLCERLLSQRSPWSSRRIVRSGDMPVSGVLPCSHVFHAECLEQMTPKASKSDPPCPVCGRLEEDNVLEQRTFTRLRNSFPRLRQSSEDGPSRPWGCMQMGDCVDGALHASPHNAMLLLSRNRVKKNLSLKANSSKEFRGRLKKTGLYTSQFLGGKPGDLGSVGCSMAAAGPSVRK